MSQMNLLMRAVEEYLIENHPEWEAVFTHTHECLITIRPRLSPTEVYIIQINMKAQSMIIVPGYIYHTDITETNLLQKIALFINMKGQK